MQNTNYGIYALCSMALEFFLKLNSPQKHDDTQKKTGHKLDIKTMRNIALTGPLKTLLFFDSQVLPPRARVWLLIYYLILSPQVPHANSHMASKHTLAVGRRTSRFRLSGLAALITQFNRHSRNLEQM